MYDIFFYIPLKITYIKKHTREEIKKSFLFFNTWIVVRVKIDKNIFQIT